MMLTRFLECRNVQFSFRSRLTPAIFLALVAAVAITTAGLTLRVGVADVWSDSLSVRQVNRALRLDPNNAALHHWAGVLYSDRSDMAKAMPEFRKAVRLNSYKARYWTDLGWACIGQGDLTCASNAFRQAVLLAPRIPRVRWDALNYAVLVGDKEDAVEQLKHYVQSDGEPQKAFELYMHAFNDPDALWNEMTSLPVTQERQDKEMVFLAFLAKRGDIRESGGLWNDFVARSHSLRFESVQPYLGQLVASSHYAEAARVWRGLESLGIVPRSDNGNLVFNPTFEQRPLPSPFDWQSSRLPYVSVDFANHAPVNATHAMRIDYTVPDNSDSEAACQLVPVDGNQTYTLSAQVRSENITSDSGPELRITYPECLSCPATTTEGTVGTQGWHQVSVTFTAPPKTSVVEISIWRPRSRSFPKMISGHFWVGSVSLFPTTASGPERSAFLSR